ncbi:phosphoglycerate dehydrogenase [uncultured Metabacillus sp.]|uniref:phosphoglycerate dehydrogenase n=1 Tax=uncultured Metabacillus sp. TaxID=2860135 RepID=UPI00261F9A5D|nr:phosphoglycerate dehydrogenase [uncultured Metabacillus sp.]
MKVISTSPSFGMYSNEPIEYLNHHGIELVRISDQAPQSEWFSAVEDADALIIGYTEINQHLLDHAPNLKIVCKHGVGVDNIDLEATKQKSVWATNVPDGNKMAVADYAFGLFFSLARNIPQANALTKGGEWPRIIGTEVFGKTLGVVGLGRIGKEVVRRAKGFDMRIIAFDPYPDLAFAEEHGVEFTELSDLLRRSDFVTLHMPLNEQTKNLIGSDELNMMKDTAYLINVSRGGMVDEHALYTGLVEKKIAGAAVDVFLKEPVTDHPLFSLPNFIATSHIAGYTYEAINKVGMTCVENIVNVLVKGEKPVHVVNQL